MVTEVEAARESVKDLTLGDDTAAEQNTRKELFRVRKETETKLTISPYPHPSLQPVQVIPRFWEEETTNNSCSAFIGQAGKRRAEVGGV